MTGWRRRWRKVRNRRKASCQKVKRADLVKCNRSSLIPDADPRVSDLPCQELQHYENDSVFRCRNQYYPLGVSLDFQITIISRGTKGSRTESDQHPHHHWCPRVLLDLDSLHRQLDGHRCPLPLSPGTTTVHLANRGSRWALSCEGTTRSPVRVVIDSRRPHLPLRHCHQRH